MLIADTYKDAQGQGWLAVRKTRGWIDILCALIADSYCQHDIHGVGRCIIDPPRWTYWIGGHHRYSLGGLMWHLGQKILRRNGTAPILYRQPLTELELRGLFGWPEHIVTDDAEDDVTRP